MSSERDISVLGVYIAMNKDLVSTIITTHNRKNLVIKAINSVLSQTYKYIECIVIDDNSDNETKKIIEPFIIKGQVKYYHIDANESQGGCYARNLGVKISSGEFIAFLDDDDEWLPTKIEKQVDILKNNIDVGFVYCGMIREKNYSKRIVEDIFNLNKFPEGDLSKEILIKVICNTSQIMMRKSLFYDVGGFDLKLRYWQEYDLCVRVFQKTKVRCVHENLVLYRIISNDKERLSNNIDGYEDTVKYILTKYDHFYRKLSYKEKTLRKYYISMDGLIRSKKAKRIKYIMKYSVQLALNFSTWSNIKEIN